MEHGFKWTIATKKPLMKPANMQTSRNSDLPGSTNSTADDWKRVLWTDESRFELFGQHHVCPQKSWRTFWWQMHCTHSETQWRFRSGIEFHLWKWHEKVVKISCIMNKNIYHNILVHHSPFCFQSDWSRICIPSMLQSCAETICTRKGNLESKSGFGSDWTNLGFDRFKD